MSLLQKKLQKIRRNLVRRQNHLMAQIPAPVVYEPLENIVPLFQEIVLQEDDSVEILSLNSSLENNSFSDIKDEEDVADLFANFCPRTKRQMREGLSFMKGVVLDNRELEQRLERMHEALFEPERDICEENEESVEVLVCKIDPTQRDVPCFQRVFSKKVLDDDVEVLDESEEEDFYGISDDWEC